MVTMPWWVLLVLMFLPLLGVLLGAWAVFKTKHAQMGIPFMEMPHKRESGEVGNYLPHSMRTQMEEEEPLSPEAERLRNQETEPDQLMSFLKGEQ